MPYQQGYGHSGKAMKGWVTCPFAMTTDLQVVLEYHLIPVAPCSHDSFWNIWPRGYFKMEYCASVSTRKSAGLPPLLGLSKARGWALSPVPFSFSTLPALVPWSPSPIVQGFHSSSVPASLATHTLVSPETAPMAQSLLHALLPTG